jgi:septal ring factor EnvC (AmiA/AmiB activator)
MKGLIKILSLSIILFLLHTDCRSQTRNELEKQRMQIIRDIEKTSKELEKTKSSKEQNLTKLKILEDQMSSRKKLLSNLQYEVKINDNIINRNENTISKLKLKHESLKDQFATLARRNYYKKMSNSKWTYILSSENLNNLFLRWRYMHQLETFTSQKLKEIQSLTGEIKQKNQEILETKEKSLITIQETSKNVATLEKEQKEKDQIVKKLSQEEDKLKATLKKREKERENLNLAIEKVIIAELNKSKSKEKSDVSAVKKKEIDNSGFSKNQGALDWPVSKGKITGRFGIHPHPTIKSIEVSNNGVDFTIPGDVDVTCIYEGEVVGITSIPGFNIMIIIRHGSYYTVYSKLESVSVSKGQKLKLGQKIGTVTSGGDGNSELHFELWKDKVKLDPQKWFNK